jgi:8-oxo-dGTP pyrophosphatase MutT (NUDIX family)
VLVTDGVRLLLGHATGSPRWDIPKGVAEPGEEARNAAVRELKEETGLVVPPTELQDLGLHRYRPGKDLALFAWHVPELPSPGTLTCVSTFTARDGSIRPEFDRFALVPLAEVAPRLGRSLATLLVGIGMLPG